MSVQAVVTCFQIFNSKWRSRVEYPFLLIVFVKEVAAHTINLLHSSTFLFCEVLYSQGGVRSDSSLLFCCAIPSAKRVTTIHRHHSTDPRTQQTTVFALFFCCFYELYSTFFMTCLKGVTLCGVCWRKIKKTHMCGKWATIKIHKI
jgi:hypothetical protein